MAASDNLSRAQFYHGSPNELKPGDSITPETSSAARDHPISHAYYTPKLDFANGYGHVYEVRPMQGNRPVTEHEPDTVHEPGDAYQTSHSLKVIAKVRPETIQGHYNRMEVRQLNELTSGGQDMDWGRYSL